MQGPYKETQASIFGELIRVRKCLFFLSFATCTKVQLDSFREAVEEKNYVLQFLNNDLFRYEPLKGVKLQHYFAQSSALIYVKDNEIKGGEVLHSIQGLLHEGLFALEFIKCGKYFMTEQEMVGALNFIGDEVFIKVSSLFGQYVRGIGFFIISFIYFFRIIFFFSSIKNANISTVIAKGEKS